METVKIDLTNLSLPNAHSQVFEQNSKDNQMFGFLVDYDGNLINTSMDLPHGTKGYFLIYDKDQSNNKIFQIPDHQTETPSKLIRISYNADNLKIQKQIIKILDFITAPIDLFNKWRNKDNLEFVPVRYGIVTTWSLTSPVRFKDFDLDENFGSDKIKLLVTDFKIGSEKASFGCLSYNYT